MVRTSSRRRRSSRGIRYGVGGQWVENGVVAYELFHHLADQRRPEWLWRRRWREWQPVAHAAGNAVPALAFGHIEHDGAFADQVFKGDCFVEIFTQLIDVRLGYLDQVIVQRVHHCAADIEGMPVQPEFFGLRFCLRNPFRVRISKILEAVALCSPSLVLISWVPISGLCGVKAVRISNAFSMALG